MKGGDATVTIDSQLYGGSQLWVRFTQTGAGLIAVTYDQSGIKLGHVVKLGQAHPY